MIVAAVAGRKSRHDRRKELRARLDRAVSTCPALASLIGFNELTKPDNMKKHATQAGPWATSRNTGACIQRDGPPIPSPGLTMYRAKAMDRWLNITKTAAIPRRPWRSGLAAMLQCECLVRPRPAATYIGPGSILEGLPRRISVSQSGPPFGRVGTLGEHANRG